MDGFELAKNIRTQEAGQKHIPIVALTANALKGEKEHCLSVGMDDYLSKPAQLEDLRITLEKYLSVNTRDSAIASNASPPVVRQEEAIELPVNIQILKELVGDDPMNPEDWYKNNERCVFYQDRLTGAYGVGHASFTKSPDGKEDWIVYHGMRDPTNGWSARTIRTQRFTWNEDGTPDFPRPGYGPYAVPSGQS